MNASTACLRTAKSRWSVPYSPLAPPPSRAAWAGSWLSVSASSRSLFLRATARAVRAASLANASSASSNSRIAPRNCGRETCGSAARLARRESGAPAACHRSSSARSSGVRTSVKRCARKERWISASGLRSSAVGTTSAAAISSCSTRPARPRNPITTSTPPSCISAATRTAASSSTALM